MLDALRQREPFLLRETLENLPSFDFRGTGVKIEERPLGRKSKLGRFSGPAGNSPARSMTLTGRPRRPLDGDGRSVEDGWGARIRT
jgi:hypothetical protein